MTKINRAYYDKETKEYVASLKGEFERPKKGTHSARMFEVVCALLCDKKRNEFTERDVINVIAKESGKSPERVIQAQGSKYSQGKIHSALYTLLCIAKGRGKIKTRGGKLSNQFGAMRKCLVSSEGNISLTAGTYMIHPDLRKTRAKVFSAPLKSTLRDSCAVLAE